MEDTVPPWLTILILLGAVIFYLVVCCAYRKRTTQEPLSPEYILDGDPPNLPGVFGFMFAVAAVTAASSFAWEYVTFHFAAATKQKTMAPPELEPMQAIAGVVAIVWVSAMAATSAFLPRKKE